jgi:hypothetical protein
MFFGVARHNGRSHDAAVERLAATGHTGGEVLYGRRIADQQRCRRSTV